MAHGKQFFSAREVADMLGVCPKTVRAWCRTEPWGCAKGGPNGRSWKIHISLVRKWGGVQSIEEQMRDYRPPKGAEEE